MPKFSIILPVKNGGSYIKECVISILSQTIQDFNLIILENNSTDSTREWLQSLNNDRIIIYESDLPLSIEENWSRIKDTPKNEFMTLIGYDDVLEPNYLEIMNDLIQKHPSASLYQAHFKYINATGEHIRYCIPMDETQFAHEFLGSFMCRGIDSTGTGYMMRSADYDNVGGMDPLFPNLIFADYKLWTLLTLIKYKATSPVRGFRYRLHESVSKTTNSELYASAFKKFLDFILKMSSNEKIKAVIKVYGKEMLMYHCEALSHRILKTPGNLRKITVKEFIDQCVDYSTVLIPGQNFQPFQKFRIRIAAILDSNRYTRQIFMFFKAL